MADSDDLTRVFARYRPRLLRYFAGRQAARGVSEDLAQEAWIRFARNGTAALAAPWPYMLKIARNLVIDQERLHRRRLGAHAVAEILDLADEQPSQEKTLEDRDQLACLGDILRELPERQRRALVASRVEQRPHAEIARSLGVSVRTVEMDIRRAIEYCGARLQKKNRI